MSAFFRLGPSSTALTVLPAVLDGWAEVSNNRFILQEPTELIAALAVGSGMSRAVLDSDNFREVAPLELAPTATSLVGTSLLSMPFFPPAGKSLPPLSGLSASMSTSSPNEPQLVFAWFGNTPSPLPAKNIWTVRTTRTVTTVQGVWRQARLDLVGNLPIGRYKLVGCFCHATVGGAIRFRFKDQRMLPGTIVSPSTQGFQIQELRRGQLGGWGEFESTNPPYIEVLSQTSGSRSYTIYLDVIKVR